MCWGVGATAAMIAAGTAGTIITIRRGDAPAIPLALGWFTLMEGLQLWGYAVLDRCGTPANEVVTYLSLLHIALQPLVINAFIMATVAPVRTPWRRDLIHGLGALAALLVLLQLYPFAWAGPCAPGSTLCAEVLCTRSGTWHLAWDMPYNGMMLWLDTATGMTWGFPSYLLAVFVLPLFYGAWRFVLFHALIGPLAARLLTRDPNEMPAIWCLFSIGIILVALVPSVRKLLSARRSGSTPPGEAA